MEETTAYTVISADAPSEGSSGYMSAAAGILAGLLAMALIYITAVFMPKIAAFVDRLLGIKHKESKQTPPEEYKVKDIYEGEKNLDDDKGEN